MLGLGAAHTTTCGQALVAEHAQGLDLGALTGTFAVLDHFHIARAGHSVFSLGAYLGGFGAPQDQQLTDVLNGGCIEFFGQRGKGSFAHSTIVGHDADFDQSMGIQGGVHFLFYGCGETVGSHHHDRIKVVGERALLFALGGGQLDSGHAGIIGPMKAKTKTKSKKVNKAWLHDHINDPYVKQAQKEGYRARAAYKLKEIDETLGLIKSGHLVVDLGSTPGAWSQYVRRKLSPSGAAQGDLNGRIIALDILPMEPIDSVEFILGDFREIASMTQLAQALQGRQVDVVVSDMAPNLSGIESADAARGAYLIELAMDFCQKHLKPDGALVVKVFHGSGYNEILTLFKATFKAVKTIKPKASRDRSSETFLIGLGVKP